MNKKEYQPPGSYIGFWKSKICVLHIGGIATTVEFSVRVGKNWKPFYFLMAELAPSCEFEVIGEL